jgi:crossover junction endodeoxyribonuclease RusA
MITLELRLPPSINRLWRAGRGRVYRSPRYEAWLKEAGWELAIQRPARITGQVSIVIAAGRPDRRRRDLDNIATKACLDLLVAHRVIEDDSLVASITSCWSADVAPGRLRVEVEPAQTPMWSSVSPTQHAALTSNNGGSFWR